MLIDQSVSSAGDLDDAEILEDAAGHVRSP
jgi:hypothetical protein